MTRTSFIRGQPAPRNLVFQILRPKAPSSPHRLALKFANHFDAPRMRTLITEVIAGNTDADIVLAGTVHRRGVTMSSELRQLDSWTGKKVGAGLAPRTGGEQGRSSEIWVPSSCEADSHMTTVDTSGDLWCSKARH